MKKNSFETKVSQHFKFLLDENGFSIISSSDNLVVLRSRICQVRILLERYQVFFDISSTIDPNTWFDLSVLTAYITQESGEGDWEYHLPRGVPLSEAIDQQLARLAEILQRYFRQITPLFREITYKQTKNDLIEFRKRRAEERRKRLMDKK